MNRPVVDTAYWSQDAATLAAALDSGPGAVIVIVAGYIVATELAKAWFFRSLKPAELLN